MSFEKIYEAAIKQDIQALRDAIGLGCIDENKKGGYRHSAGYQLALEKNTVSSEFLIQNGANINRVAQGAGAGGHREYAEELIRRGANINWVAYGAATSGHREYAEDLIRRGVHINWVAYGAGVSKHREYAEDLIRRGADIDEVACGAGVSGNREYAEDLIRRGANIDEVAYGAGVSGHREYAEDLIRRGANIDWVAYGAGTGGHREYAHDLILHHANIDELACGAGVGGHQEYAEDLIQCGANINLVAKGAGLGGHREYAEDLIRRGANIDEVAYGAGAEAQISERTENQIAYLSFYPPDIIPKLVNEFKKLNNPILIDQLTEKRAVAISKNIFKANLSFSQALTRTDPECNGMLYLLMLCVMRNENICTLFSNKNIPSLPDEIWMHIFNFATPMKLNIQDFENLGFVVGRAYLCAQLSSYQSGWGKHKERAHSFFQAVSATKNKKDMQELISKQVQVLQRNNPYQLLERDKKYKTNIEKNPILDKYYGIVGFWEKMQTGRDVFEDKQPLSSKKCSIL